LNDKIGINVKNNLVIYLFVTAFIFSAGCATMGTEGVVAIGSDLYMIGGLGKVTDHSGSAVKARFFQEASRYCQEKGRSMFPVNSTGQDAGGYTWASAEVQFRCVLQSDAK